MLNFIRNTHYIVKTISLSSYIRKFTLDNTKKYKPGLIFEAYNKEIKNGRFDEDLKQLAMIKELEKLSYILSTYKKPTLPEWELVKVSKQAQLTTEKFYITKEEANEECKMKQRDNQNDKYFIRPIRYQSILSTTLKKRHTVLPSMRINRLPTEVNYDNEISYNSNPNPELSTKTKTTTELIKEINISDVYDKPSNIVLPDTPNYKIPRGLYLYGSVGTGKSMLMKLFYELSPVNENLKRRIHFHEFMQEIHESIHTYKLNHYKSPNNLSESIHKNYYSENDAIVEVSKNIAKSYTLLCLDEFQVTDIADAIIMSNIFEILFKFGTIIVSTSNQSPNDLYSNGLNRHIFLPFISLLTRWCKVLDIDSKIDYRQTKYIPNNNTYYYPVTNDNLKKIEEENKELFEKGKSCDLRICRGRYMKIELSDENEKTALIDFNVLCKEVLIFLIYIIL